MAEPPRQYNLANDGQSDEPPNPFAPTHMMLDSSPARTELNGLFWVTSSVIFLLSVALSFWSYLGIACFINSVFAFARAILVQRELSSRNCYVLPDATYLLIVSWGFNLALVVASLVSFVIVCIPAGIAFGLDIGPMIAGCTALAAYAVLFYTSLKLPF